MTSTQPLLLAGDIGATKTTLALYSSAAVAQPGKQPHSEETFQNRNFTCFDDVLAVFLGPGGLIPPYACIGIAGPVLNDKATMTNLSWQLDARALEKRHGFIRVHLINDLVATAVGIPLLGSRDLSSINTGKPPDAGALAVLAPGTGLGQAFLIPHGNDYLPCPSEGGHATFAPRNDDQLDLLDFMRQRQRHVSVEQVCSGLAVPDLFAFMSTRHTVPEWLNHEVEQAEDPTPINIEAARRAVEGKRVCGVAVHTVQLLCDILADEAANLVLKTMALGGIYLGGGLAPRLQPFLQPERFMRIFSRDYSSSMLTHTPVYIIKNRQTALLGAGEYGRRALIRVQTGDPTIPSQT